MCAITGTLSFLFGIFVYLRNRSSSVNKIWMILNFCVSLWSWSLFARELAYEKTTALFFVRLCYVGAIFIPPLFFHFVNSFLKLQKKKIDCSLLCVKLYFLNLRFHPFIHQRRKANTFLSLLRNSRNALSFLCSFVYRYYRLQPLHLNQVF